MKMFGGASERVPTRRVPSVMRPSLVLSILSIGVTSVVVYLSSVCWSLPFRASVGVPLGWEDPPPHAASETARASATGAVVSHFIALIFIRLSLSYEAYVDRAARQRCGAWHLPGAGPAVRAGVTAKLYCLTWVNTGSWMKNAGPLAS